MTVIEYSIDISAERAHGDVCLTHGEVFSGMLVPIFFRGALRRGTELGFQAINQALKQRAESKDKT